MLTNEVYMHADVGIGEHGLAAVHEPETALTREYLGPSCSPCFGDVFVHHGPKYNFDRTSDP